MWGCMQSDKKTTTKYIFISFFIQSFISLSLPFLNLFFLSSFLPTFIYLCSHSLFSSNRYFSNLFCLFQFSSIYNPVVLGYIIRRLYIFRGVRQAHNICPGYDTKSFDNEAPFLEFLGIWGNLHSHKSLANSDAEQQYMLGSPLWGKSDYR